MRYAPFIVLAAIAALGLAGCGCGHDDGLKPDVSQQLDDASRLAKSVDGDYDKLTPEQKQIFLKMVNGDETQAKARVKMIAHPPNEMYQKKGAPANGVAPGAAPAGK